MKPERLLRAILPDVLIDNFDIVNFDKSADRFDIYLDEKKVQLKEDKTNPDIWGIERSGFFNGREKWAKGFENQRV